MNTVKYEIFSFEKQKDEAICSLAEKNKELETEANRLRADAKKLEAENGKLVRLARSVDELRRTNADLKQINETQSSEV